MRVLRRRGRLGAQRVDTLARSILGRAVGLGLAALALAACAGSSPGPGGSSRAADGVTAAGPGQAAWLDAPLRNWNAPGRSIPAAPAPSGDRPDDPRCAKSVRQPVSSIDQAVRAAGWFLFTDPGQPFTDTTVVQGNTAVDGMCRPWGYQVFVFLGGAFAGTLSPVPMDARTDGALVRVEASGDNQLAAHYARYAPGDPLCCPSRTSTATYRLDRTERLVVPLSVQTRAP